MSVTTTQVWRIGAQELAKAIRSKQLSSREVVESHVRRIETVNPKLNAITVLLADQALAAADAAEKAAAAGKELERFHGVPFTIEENVGLVGTATTQGVKPLAGAEPTMDAPVVEAHARRGSDSDRAHQPLPIPQRRSY